MKKAIRAYTLSECMEIMGEHALAFEKLGGENIIFCEDRLTLIAERALLAAVGGTFQTTVTTFSRFLSVRERTVSKQGSVMLVGEVMTNLQRENKLQCFTSSVAVGKNALAIYETLAQFSASQITPEVLRESLLLLPEDTLKRKVADLALIYEGYLAVLAERGYLDESRYLSRLPEEIREKKRLRGKNVFFLGYASFTAQAKETIRAALETAQNVVGIFCGGEEEMYTNRAFDGFVGVCREYGEPTIVNGGTPLEGAAEPLRRGLFNPERGERLATDKIFLYEAEDKTAEAEYAAVKIKRAMGENDGLRYRDFALLVPTATDYMLPLKKAFNEYGIPYFIDEKKTMREHPLSRFVLDCFRVVKEGYASSAVQSMTGNYFFGESDEYRNYLYKFANYRGGAKRGIKKGETVEKHFCIERLEEGRKKLLLATENIKARGYGRDYCRAVRKILLDFEVDKKLEGLDNALDDVAQKGYLSQIARAFESVLGEAESLVGGKETTVAEFAAVLEDGFSAMEISLIPLKADAVFIGEIASSRIEKVNTLFCLGLTDEVPSATADTAIVSDREIAKLAEVKTLLEPTVAEVNLRGRESVCLNLCTFTDRLYLSYPLSSDGAEPSLSEIFRYIDALFCDAEGGNLQREKRLSEGDFPYQCAAATPAIRQALLQKSNHERGWQEDLSACGSIERAMNRVGVTALDEYWALGENESLIARGEELFFSDGRISPTSLEGYFDCPFGHFAEKGLRLKEQEQATVLAVDSGNFIHLLLQKTAMKAKEMTEEELKAYAKAEGEKLLQSSVYLLQQDTGVGQYSAEKLLDEGVEVAVAAYRQIKNSDFEVKGTEVAVQNDLIFGKVDRVDETKEFVRIVDYKTGRIDDSPTSYYTGRKIQMQLYMDAVKGDRTPVGVFYFPASVEYSTEDEGRYRMKGFLSAEESALKAGDCNITTDKKSEYFGASLKKDARLNKVMDTEVFEDFLHYGTLVAKQGAKEIKEGYIAPSPYEGSCKYCKYGGMCGFNREVLPARKEGKISPSSIANIANPTRKDEQKED